MQHTPYLSSIERGNVLEDYGGTGRGIKRGEWSSRIVDSHIIGQGKV